MLPPPGRGSAGALPACCALPAASSAVRWLGWGDGGWDGETGAGGKLTQLFVLPSEKEGRWGGTGRKVGVSHFPRLQEGG